ncbi:hypothetical protein GCM10025866_28900 [Naasia aerilata]|uniref:DNA/pantothenate metabolism flavoprotein C-terminal domain-containing protein n=1 Tax=Naasia aerilata TaxID=1162966 RepID=A0ABM8GF63_9MICO|nr:hypothetical protein GCM10025866_28900 [Naasia aerilata]
MPAPLGVEVRTVETTEQLAAAVAEGAALADTVIMAAAVADYRPERVADAKLKKESMGEEYDLRLVRNPDILRELTSGRLAAERPEGQIVIGFAAETEQDSARLLEMAREKAARKGVDYLVLNRVGWAEGFGTPRNTVTVLDRAGSIVSEAAGDKLSVAHRILDVIV